MNQGSKPPDTGKGKETPPSWSLQKEHSPADPFSTSELQNCKVINLCCSKPLWGNLL